MAGKDEVEVLDQDVREEGTCMKLPIFFFLRDLRGLFSLDSLGREIIAIALPAALALAADPVASLIDTAFLGHLGPVDIAAVGVSVAIFNQVSRITVFPVVSVATSLVAEEDTSRKAEERKAAEKSVKAGSTKGTPNHSSTTQEDLDVDDIENGSSVVEMNETIHAKTKDNNSNEITKPKDGKVGGKVIKPKRVKKKIATASTALVVGGMLGVLQAIFLILGGKTFLNFMGVKNDSPMMEPALKYLSLRALGSPAVLLSLAMNGVFRGFKDTKTPLFATVVGDLANIVLDPILIFTCKLGVSGAAISHALSQYLMCSILFFTLLQRLDIVPPSLKQLQIGRFLKNAFLLFARVLAVTFCVTIAASLAARLGSIPMAAFQVCLQVWLTSSLLADGLAVAGQAILACAFAEKDYSKAAACAARVSQMGFVMGMGLSVLVGVGLHFGAGVFSQDPSVLHLINIGIPFIAATQPINSFAFVLDGVNFGASDFGYCAYSMLLMAVGSITAEFFLSRAKGFTGIWYALTIYMLLRTVAGVWRMVTATGPWRFLRN